MSALAIVTLLTLSFLVGNEFCVAAFLEPVLRSLPEETQVPAVPRFAARLGKAMPPWYAVSILLTGFQTYRSLSTPHFAYVAASLGLQLVVLGLTLSLLVPRNSRLAKMQQPYPGWQPDAVQWDSLHRIRVALLFAACVCLGLAL